MTLLDDMIKEIIPKVRVRLKFLKQLDILKQNMQIEVPTYLNQI